MKKLFTRFGKLQRTAESNSDGIGLGLNIVRTIVEKSGGTINVQSEGVNRGSLFYFSIPIKAGMICEDPNSSSLLCEQGSNSELVILEEELKGQIVSKNKRAPSTL